VDGRRPAENIKGPSSIPYHPIIRKKRKKNKKINKKKNPTAKRENERFDFTLISFEELLF
jgi:hypothetical protein